VEGVAAGAAERHVGGDVDVALAMAARQVGQVICMSLWEL